MAELQIAGHDKQDRPCVTRHARMDGGARDTVPQQILEAVPQSCWVCGR